MKNIFHFAFPHYLIPFGLSVMLAACSGDSDPGQQTTSVPSGNGAGADVNQAGPAVFELIDTMYSNMGGIDALQDIDNLVLEGSGTRTHVGQIPETGGEDVTGIISGLTETIDLENGRAAVEYGIQMGGFSQQRTEVITRYQSDLVAWNTNEGQPGQVVSVNGLLSWATHNNPQTLLQRNAVIMALAAQNSDVTQMPREVDVQGNAYWSIETTREDEDVTLYINRDDGMLGGWQVLDTESIWGDVETTYLVSDYNSVDGVMLPFQLDIIKPDGEYASITYQSIAVNDDSALEIFVIPENLSTQADQVLASDGPWVPLQWNPVTESVTHVTAFSHNSMVVEFSDFVVVVEAPYSEAQSMSLARMVENNIGKPIRYAVPSHPHYDHTSGIRALVSLGASVLTAEGHEDELRMLVESAHSNPPDVLATQIAQGAEVGQIEVFSGMTEVADGEQTLELYEVTGIPHVSPKVLAFVPDGGVLFQSDLFFGAASPDAEALYQAVQDLGLDVQQIVGGHGGVFPFSVLEQAASGN